MMKRKALWALLAAGMTVVSTGIVSAQSTMAAPRVGMLGEFKKKSLVGSWFETFTFVDGRIGRAPVNYNDDGILIGPEGGSTMFDTDPQKASVTRIRDVIDTISSKAVLILGRFSDDRKSILNALRDALRNKGFLPIVFDFERPIERDFTETIMTLAGMSCFVIADITNPKSAPLELQATIPDCKVPFVPILQDGESAFSMFSNLQTKYDWVLCLLKYDSSENLIDVLDDAVINPALEKRHELELRKAQNGPTRHVEDYRKASPR
jgi:hypothetical protein